MFTIQSFVLIAILLAIFIVVGYFAWRILRRTHNRFWRVCLYVFLGYWILQPVSVVVVIVGISLGLIVAH